MIEHRGHAIISEKRGMIMSENNKEVQAEPEIELTLAGADETPAA